VPSPGTFNIGVTTITYTLTHATGIQESCSFTITVNSPPEITCPINITQNTDTGLCSAMVTITPATATPADAVVTGVRSDGLLFTDPFPVGVTTITWTATNLSGSVSCTQTVTVVDNIKPTFVLPTPFIECVESIFTAVYDATTTDITPPRPEYYTFKTGDIRLNLDPAKFADNCSLSSCTPPPTAIRWQIDFFGGTPSSLTGTGQPSTHADFQLPGDGVAFANVKHTITYWITDCAGNESLPMSQDITIKPRPKLTKVP
jgi:hypothetical protein